MEGGGFWLAGCLRALPGSKCGVRRGSRGPEQGGGWGEAGPRPRPEWGGGLPQKGADSHAPTLLTRRLPPQVMLLRDMLLLCVLLLVTGLTVAQNETADQGRRCEYRPSRCPQGMSVAWVSRGRWKGTSAFASS